MDVVVDVDVEWMSSGCRVDVKWMSSGCRVDVKWIWSGRRVDVKWMSSRLPTQFHLTANGEWT